VGANVTVVATLALNPVDAVGAWVGVNAGGVSYEGTLDEAGSWSFDIPAGIGLDEIVIFRKFTDKELKQIRKAGLAGTLQLDGVGIEGASVKPKPKGNATTDAASHFAFTRKKVGSPKSVAITSTNP